MLKAKTTTVSRVIIRLIFRAGRKLGSVMARWKLIRVALVGRNDGTVEPGAAAHLG